MKIIFDSIGDLENMFMFSITCPGNLKANASLFKSTCPDHTQISPVFCEKCFKNNGIEFEVEDESSRIEESCEGAAES